MTERNKILIIEDNAQNLYLATYLLEHHGYIVSAASTGPAGLAQASEVRPDIILLDIQLPGMDGHEVARRLKADPVMKSVPVIAVTSFALAGDREKSLDAGIEGYIEKPINPDTFADEIRNFIAEYTKE